MNRNDQLQRLDEPRIWDLLVIGGGATGLGVAVDAASRGLAVCLLEAEDFAKGTSSRSTKLVHGGVRYLQQGNVSLVMEALHERGLMRANAPHLVQDLAFAVPSYQWWESPFYGVGLKVYDLLAGRHGFGRSRSLSREEILARIPNLATEGLRGGTLYFDGQFDDARFAITLALTAHDLGAVLVNHCPVTGLVHEQGQVRGAEALDRETGRTLSLRARAVVNAGGPFADAIRRLDRPDAAPMIAPSRGVHLVLDRSFLSGDSAIMVPHTSDGRVMFALPWQGVVVVGTTDTAIEAVDAEPVAAAEEVDFILETANRYLARDASRRDVLSVFAGIRPLVRSGEATRTSAISREHVVHVDPDSGLITVAGGKWTTYRRMAEDLVDTVLLFADLPARLCETRSLRLHGWRETPAPTEDLAVHGSDAEAIMALARSEPALAEPIHPRLPATGARLAWSIRHEAARTVDDLLARRTRCLLLDAAAAIEAAPKAAALLARELGRDDSWAEAEARRFAALAANYRV